MTGPLIICLNANVVYYYYFGTLLNGVLVTNKSERCQVHAVWVVVSSLKSTAHGNGAGRKLHLLTQVLHLAHRHRHKKLVMMVQVSYAGRHVEAVPHRMAASSLSEMVGNPLVAVLDPGGGGSKMVGKMPCEICGDPQTYVCWHLTHWQWIYLWLNSPRPCLLQSNIGL